MRRLLGLLARGTSTRIGRGLVHRPSTPCGRHHLFGPSSQSPSPSHPIPTAGGSSFDHFLRSWRPRQTPAGFSGLLGLLPARRALPSSLARNLMAVWGAGRSASCPGTLVDRGFRWMAFSLQKRQGFRLHDYYQRWNFWRSWMPTSHGVVYGLIGVNVAVFILWRIADPRFMMENFTISLDNFKSGRLHTLITSAFSHMDGDHCLINMFGFYFFGTNIARLFGPEFLLKLYIAGAISGSVFYLLHKALIASSKGMNMVYHSRDYALGASAAVNAILLLDVFLFPKNIIYLNFFIPVPAALVVSVILIYAGLEKNEEVPMLPSFLVPPDYFVDLFQGAVIIGSDLWRIKRGDERVSGSAHLGGALVAALVWARIKKRWI